MIYNGVISANLLGTEESNRLGLDGQLSYADGRGGDDVVLANGLFDTVVGGSGLDTVDYSEATEGVVITQNPLDGVLIGEDGAVGDVIVGCEIIVGSRFR